MEEGRGIDERLFAGPAGWSYADWEGPVYQKGRGTDRLLFIARYFDCVELNSSFYRTPSTGMVAGWAARLADAGRFRMCVKVSGGFTHERDLDPSRLEEFMARFDPLAAEDLLGPFLLQFPWSFRKSDESSEYLRRLSDAASGRDTVVELRHGSWNDPSTFDLLAGLGLAWCNIDQPQVGCSVPPTSEATVPGFSYIRMHGRNSRDWFRKGAGRDARYDYLYSPAELEEWAGRARDLLSGVSRLFVITNNHYRGQAVANALQLRSILEGRALDCPPGLAREYPEIEKYVRRGPGTGLLFS